VVCGIEQNYKLRISTQSGHGRNYVKEYDLKRLILLAALATAALGFGGTGNAQASAFCNASTAIGTNPPPPSGGSGTSLNVIGGFDCFPNTSAGWYEIDTQKWNANTTSYDTVRRYSNAGGCVPGCAVLQGNHERDYVCTDSNLGHAIYREALSWDIISPSTTDGPHTVYSAGRVLC
jgi:hypothetical protein